MDKPFLISIDPNVHYNVNVVTFLAQMSLDYILIVS